MAVTLETSPHPLLNTEHQLQLKRRVILPNNIVHRLEWRYFPRFQRDEEGGGAKEMVSLRRRMRVGGRGGGTSGPLNSGSLRMSHDLHDVDADNDESLVSSYTEGYAGKALTVCYI